MLYAEDRTKNVVEVKTFIWPWLRLWLSTLTQVRFAALSSPQRRPAHAQCVSVNKWRLSVQGAGKFCEHGFESRCFSSKPSQGGQLSLGKVFFGQETQRRQSRKTVHMRSSKKSNHCCSHAIVESIIRNFFHTKRISQPDERARECFCATSQVGENGVTTAPQ